MHPTVAFPAKNHSYISPWCQKSAETLHLDLKGLAWVYSCLNSPAPWHLPPACSPLSSQHEHPSHLRFLCLAALYLCSPKWTCSHPSCTSQLRYYLMRKSFFDLHMLFCQHSVFVSCIYHNLLCLFTDLITVWWSLSTSLACIRPKIKGFFYLDVTLSSRTWKKNA